MGANEVILIYHRAFLDSKMVIVANKDTMVAGASQSASFGPVNLMSFYDSKRTRTPYWNTPEKGLGRTERFV